MSLTPEDLRILSQLQGDASLSRDQLADAVRLTPKQLAVRMEHLRKGGWLERIVALISNERVGLPLTVFCFVSTDERAFDAVVAGIPEAAEVYELGEEYVIKLMVADSAHYAGIEAELRARLPGADIRARPATRKVKFTTELPLPRAAD